MEIPECLPFNITTNACRGYCTSFSIPSPSAVLASNPNQLITSYGNCCGMKETVPVSMLTTAFADVNTRECCLLQLYVRNFLTSTRGTNSVHCCLLFVLDKIVLNIFFQFWLSKTKAFVTVILFFRFCVCVADTVM